MDTLDDLINAVQTDMTIGAESTFNNPAAVKLAVQRAYRKAGGLFLWPETEDAKKTSTGVNQEYYDYPQNWRPDSIWKIKVDGVDYGDPLIFKSYLFEKENDIPSGLEYMWTNQWRRFFIYPIPTTAGDNNICLWGQKVVDPIVNGTDTTIFSYSMQECNEAIVLEAKAILRDKGENQNAAAFSSGEAKQILAVAWGKIQENAKKYEDTQPMFDVPDFFSGRGSSNRDNRGRF